MLERAFDTRMMELVQRWWNGRFGRLARRDIWLEREVIWHVKARNGDGDSPIKAWAFSDHDDAQDLVQRLLAKGGDGWRNLTKNDDTRSTPEPGTRRASRSNT